jgi:hypothetical protein
MRGGRARTGAHRSGVGRVGGTVSGRRWGLGRAVGGGVWSMSGDGGGVWSVSGDSGEV